MLKPPVAMRQMLVTVVLSCVTMPLMAQKPDYHRADVIRTASRYAFGTSVAPAWLEDSVRFWYQSDARADRGVVYLVDPARATRTVLFENARLAAALSVSADTMIDPGKLPTFQVIDSGRTVEMRLRKKVFRC